MNRLLINLYFIVLLSFSNALPHFIYDGIESFHDCSGENEEISFSIYGTFTDSQVDLEKIKVNDYLIEDMGLFECSLQENELPTSEKRKYKIICRIKGLFERKGYILDEPKVLGFDFNKEDGESSWPKIEERKTFLIGECGARIELDDEPLLLASSENTYVNPLNTVRKDIVDKALASLPPRSSVDEDGMCSAMFKVKDKYQLDEAESAYLVYKWLSQNIAYDCYALNHGTVDHTEKGTYNKGKGVCAGYSYIFATLCKAMGLEAYYVSGYSKGASFVPGVIPKQSDHAWNSVKIDYSYYLVDSTWGSGSCEGDSYTRVFNEFFFCTDPEAFIRSHLPSENKWQLVTPTISLQTFVYALKLGSAFYENGLTSISPDTWSINSSSNFKVILTSKDNSNLAFLYHLYFLQGNNYISQNNVCLGKRGINKNEVTCLTNNKGKYKLYIYGGPANLESYPQIVEYSVESSKDAASPLYFPSLYGLYSSSDTQIIEPLYSPLKKGNFYNFNVTTTTYNNLYVYLDNGHRQELDNNGKGVFTGESIYIHGEAVNLATLDNGYFHYILQYKTEKDPNIQEEPTFPKGYSAPKNVLYSPLTDTLKRAKSYNFKIKCESVNDMIVVDGDNFYHLDKNGAIFSKTVSIRGNSGKVIFASYNSSTGQYSYFYEYAISS